MCIRDRDGIGWLTSSVAMDKIGFAMLFVAFKPVSYTHLERFKAKASRYSKKAMENYRSNGIHTVIRKSLIKLEALSKGDGLYPVSYTHLDVYKRQIYSYAWNCNNCRTNCRCKCQCRK